MMSALSKSVLGFVALGVMGAPLACASGEADGDVSSVKRLMSATIATPSDDIVPFDGTGGPTGVGVSPAEDHALAAPSDLGAPLGSNCSQTFPPAASLPCAVPETGALYVYYVSPKGDDANDGASPEHPWATLFHAAKMALPKSTIRVAEGQYTSAEVHVDRAVIIKGGFDTTFGSWDPDKHHSYFFGKLSLAHDQAIWGGFDMVSHFEGARGRAAAGEAAARANENERSTGSSEARHIISGGTLVRNYIEIDYRASEDQHSLFGIVAGAPEGHRTRLYCNDVYVRGQGVSSSPSLDVRAITYDGASSLGGEARLASNRVCVDRSRGGILSASAIAGSASGANARVTMTNNLIEAHGDTALGLRPILGVRFSSSVHDLEVVATNNTIFSETDGIVGNVGAGGGKVSWRLTNNVVFSTAGRDAIAVGPKGSSFVQISESSGNLVFGFMHNAIVPAPRVSSNDDTTGAWTIREVIGNAFLPNENGPARRDGINVFGDPVYGGVRTDLWSSIRPTDGKWTRGAVQ